jgi:putative transposase
VAALLGSCEFALLLAVPPSVSIPVTVTDAPSARPTLPDRELVEDIKVAIADTPTYGYRRANAILRRNARNLGRPWPNAIRVYRVMRLRNLLLVRHAGAADDRLHDG